MPSSADIIARRLREAGCRHAFGIPGGEVLTLMDALARAGIDFHLAKHENAAGFMAEGTHHASGVPGILVATVGPGAVNAVNVVANARQDQVPLIFLTGCVDAADALTYTHQVFDQRAALGSLVKAGFTVADGAADVTIDKAVAIALDDPPGPVHLDLPIKVAEAEEPERAPVRRARPLPGTAAGADLEKARDALRRAERPLMIAGLQVLHHGAEEDVAKTAESLGIPLITTYKAKGVLPEDHPLSLGGAGLSPKADSHLLPLVRQSDLIVLAGYDPIEMRAGWCDPWADGTLVVEFASLPNTHYVHQAGLSFVGHVGAGLAALRDGVAPHPTWPGGEPAAVRAALREAFPRDEEWGPAAVIDTVRRVLPRDGVATVDTGAHRILLSQMWECYGPRTLLQSTGLCTMGCALPLAAGYKVANPKRPVVAFTGDGGLEMVLGELATLRDLRVGVAVVVFVDDSLALIELKQRTSGLQNLGVDTGHTDFPTVAEAMGGVGAEARDREELTGALEAALAGNTFTVIACPIGSRPYDGRL